MNSFPCRECGRPVLLKTTPTFEQLVAKELNNDPEYERIFDRAADRAAEKAARKVELYGKRGAGDSRAFVAEQPFPDHIPARMTFEVPPFAALRGYRVRDNAGTTLWDMRFDHEEGYGARGGFIDLEVNV